MRQQIRRGTAAAWTAANPILLDGEAGYERDTHKLKIGDGTTAWNALAYFASSSVTLPIAESDVTNLPGDLSALSTAISTEATSRANADALLIPTSAKGVAGGVPSLDGSGKVPSNQLPSIAITDFLGVASSEAAMLALAGQRGDWCIRSDTPGGSTAWILIHDDPTSLANWQEMPTPASGVTTWNGRSGNVTGGAEQSDLDAEIARAEAAESALTTALTDGAAAEFIRDTVGVAVTAGAHITVTVSDVGDTITVAVTGLATSDLSDFATAVDERARDALGSALTAGTGISITPNDGADTITIAVSGLTSSSLSDFTEAVQDVVGAFVAAGTGMTVTYNDAGNVETIGIDTSAENERIDDRVAALLAAGTGVTLTYDDTANALTISLDSDLAAIAGFSNRDASHYLRGDGWQAFSQLLTDLNLGNTALLNLVTAGFTIPNDSLNKWKAGRGRAGTMLAGADAGSTTAVPVYDLSIQPYAGVHRRHQVEDEEVYTTANEATMTLITGVTSVASTGIFTKTAHGLIAGQIVSPDSGLLDSFLAVGGRYYVTATNLTANAFSLASYPSGPVLTGTTNDTALVLSTSVLTVATRGSVNWTGVAGSSTNLAGATSHATRSPVYAPMHKTVVHIGDSTVEGSDQEHPYQQNDSWSLRAARMLSERSGGLVAEAWPYWRNNGTAATANKQDYTTLNPGGGLVISDVNSSHDVGWPGAVFVQGQATPNATQIVWNRPTYKRVEAIDFLFVDYGAAAVQWSYSVDGGVTWYDCPIASSNFVSGKGLLRRCRFLVDNPTDFRVRSCSAAGTAHTLVIPWIPVVTWSVSPHMATTEGVFWANAGWPGKLLSGMLNARVVHDAVADGSGGLTSATASFLANDVNSVIFVDGVAGTITARTNGTTVTTDTHFAAGSGKRLSILQGSGTGDWNAQFFGHHASWFPDLVILGTLVNDIATNEPDFYCDMLQFLITNLKPYCDVLVVSPYEFSGPSTVIQASYRTAIKAKAAANNCACLDLYDAMSAYGVTGYTAANAAGYMIDTVHLSPLGNTWIGSHLARGLGLVA